MSQQVTIPAASGATLSMKLYISSAETTTTIAYDTLRVQVGSGGSTTTLATYSNLDEGTGFVTRSFDLSAFTGRTVTVKLLGTEDSALGTSFAALEGALFRMEVFERTLVAIPSGQPAHVLMLSSSYGYRSDPFTGAGAMHAGLDFPGPIGTPILAAAPGRVSFVGQKSGYGNVVEVDHGQGILTRYAHLSGFNAKVGDRVTAGQQIARMGSTGRSTGSHLHFEVRLNGVAVNPRRFLEAKADVLEVKDDARQRVGALASAGAR